MIKQPITYTDFNGNEVTEYFYFNLTRAEAMELEASVDGGLSEWLKTISAPSQPGEVIETFKKILGKSYGEKSNDGRHFVKNEMISSSFFATEAYSTLFMMLLQDAGFAASFVNQLLHNPEAKKQTSPAQQQFTDRNAPPVAPVTPITPQNQPQPAHAPVQDEQPSSAFGQINQPDPRLEPSEEEIASERLRIARMRAEQQMRDGMTE